MQVTEEWRPIPNFGNRYEISNRGRVRVVGPTAATAIRRPQYRQIGKILKWGVSQGYAHVTLRFAPEKKIASIHDLVAAAFIGPKPEGKTVNHKDGKKLHNVDSNLEYMTYKEQSHHAYHVLGCIPPRGEKHGMARLSSEDVAVIFEMRRRGSSGKDIADRFGVGRKHVYAILSGQYRRSDGYDLHHRLDVRS